MLSINLVRKWGLITNRNSDTTKLGISHLQKLRIDVGQDLTTKRNFLQRHISPRRFNLRQLFTCMHTQIQSPNKLSC